MLQLRSKLQSPFASFSKPWNDDHEQAAGCVCVRDLAESPFASFSKPWNDDHEQTVFHEQSPYERSRPNPCFLLFW